MGEYEVTNGNWHPATVREILSDDTYRVELNLSNHPKRAKIPLVEARSSYLRPLWIVKVEYRFFRSRDPCCRPQKEWLTKFENKGKWNPLEPPTMSFLCPFLCRESSTGPQRDLAREYITLVRNEEVKIVIHFRQSSSQTQSSELGTFECDTNAQLVTIANAINDEIAETFKNRCSDLSPDA